MPSSPGLTLLEDGSYPLSLAAPLTLGVGFDDYYGFGTGTTGFVGLGLSGSVPLAFVPADYGSWTLGAGVDLLLREEDLADAGKPLDDASNRVPIGSLRLALAY